MNQDRLELLLRQAVTSGSTAPRRPDCLDVRAVLNLLDHPEQTAPQALQHLVRCAYCQHAVVLARRHRQALEAGWADAASCFGDSGAEGASAGDARTTATGLPAVAPRAIRLRPWLIRLPALAGVAAVLLIAVWIGWWRRPAGELLGPVSGRFELTGVMRGDEQPARRYVVTYELLADAYVTSLYLDHSGTLQLPPDATDQAQRRATGRQAPFWVDVTHDPPGWQWLTMVAARKPFDPQTLCSELQEVLAAAGERASFDERIERLERTLRAHRELNFRSQRFEVRSAEAP